MTDRYVGVIILNPVNHILLQRKDFGYKKWPGFWTTFGGKLNENETIYEGIHREIEIEETGLSLEEITFFDSISLDERKYMIQVDPSIGNCFFYSARFNGDLSKISLREGAGFSLWHPDELPQIREKTFPYVYEVLERFYQQLHSIPLPQSI